MQEKPELLEVVNTFVLIGTDGKALLGESCFNTLCDAIKAAQTSANNYRDANPNYAKGDPLAEFWAYLPTIWYNLLKNRHFVNMYASHIVYYYYKLGYADAETMLDGDVKNKRSGNVNLGAGSENITLVDADKKATQAGAVAKQHYDAFINNFWNKNKKAYNCSVDSCDTTCNNIVTNCNTNNVQDPCIKHIPRRPRPTAL